MHSICILCCLSHSKHICIFWLFFLRLTFCFNAILNDSFSFRDNPQHKSIHMEHGKKKTNKCYKIFRFLFVYHLMSTIRSRFPFIYWSWWAFWNINSKKKRNYICEWNCTLNLHILSDIMIKVFAKREETIVRWTTANIQDKND